MVTESSLSLKGEFLIAMPGLTDPNFSHTVVCVCDHTSEGSVGLIINRTYPSLHGKDIFEELGMEFVSEPGSAPIHFGGPVHVNEVFILHGPPFDWEGTVVIKPFLAMSNTRDILEAIALGKGPESFIISLGCSGWGPNQVESEVKQNAWLTCPVSKKIIFELPLETRWEEAVKKMGINPALLSDTAGHA